MKTKIHLVDTGLPFKIPVQVLIPLYPGDIYYTDRSREVEQETYLRALGLSSLVKSDKN
jgi:hypothetical protein